MKISLLTALISLAAISCAGKTGSQVAIDGGTGGAPVVACSSDAQCGNGTSCFAGRCVERLGHVDNWAVEITPPPATNAKGVTLAPIVTELPGVGAPPVVLSASSALSLVVKFTADSTSVTAVPTTASVILTVPSRIPGRPDLAFQAGIASGEASLIVSDAVLGQQATVNLIPLPPSDVATPPYTFPDTPIPMSGPMTVNLQPASFKISGQLVGGPVDAGKGNFTARAFQNGLLASTTATTSPADGGFTIFLPAGSGPVTLELLPASSAADPWLTLAQIPLSAAPTDLGSITLPAYLKANAFRVTVHGDTSDPQPPVPGAALRAIATIPGGDNRGSTRYLRDGSTDAGGSTQLMLIPGDSQAGLMYTFSVVPPAGSPWASRCLDGVSVLYNGSATPAIPDFSLALRLVVSGTLLSVDGAPVANAVVTATRGMAAATSCLLGPATTSVITDATGAFKLALDKGDYTLDYDPPNGSPAPRLTEYDVNVSGDIVRTIRLPPPALFEGDVEDALEQPLPFTTIRIFEPRCPLVTSCLPPTLIGQTQSDAAGHFRAIVAAPPSAN